MARDPGQLVLRLHTAPCPAAAIDEAAAGCRTAYACMGRNCLPSSVHLSQSTAMQISGKVISTVARRQSCERPHRSRRPARPGIQQWPHVAEYEQE